jgi:hypothetical protein
MRMRAPGRLLLLSCLAVASLLLTACTREAEIEKPPRVDTPTRLEPQVSTGVVPLRVKISALEKLINDSVPRTLLEIDRAEKNCLPGRRITVCPVPKRECVNGKCKMVGCKFGLYRTKVTPDLSCRIIGQVDRGRIRLSGQGDRILMTMPVSATLGARNVAGFLKETANAEAELRALIGVDVNRDWQLVAKVSLDHRWKEPPGIDFLGKRINLVGKADPALKQLLDGIEKKVQADVARMPFRAGVAKGWEAGFTVIELNRKNPPVFLKVTPRRIGFGGMRTTRQDVELAIGIEAETTTAVGDAPVRDRVTPLPPPAKGIGDDGLAFNMAVIADYDVLVPVLNRTLAKLVRKGVTLPGIGAVDVAFGSVDIYPTADNRIAIGIPTTAKLRKNPFRQTKGIVWLTGRIVNEPGSQRIHVEDLRISGNTDREAINLLLRLFEDPELLAEVAGELRHDFKPDYDRVLGAARKAIAERQFGPVTLRTQLPEVVNGKILAVGQGLFMPVTVHGKASLRFTPKP